MKTFVCVLLLACIVAAEPPFRRFNTFGRQESQNFEGERNEEAPYPAAGYRPSIEFNLPARQEVSPPATSYGVPDDSYGAPLRTYTAPQTEYGVPREESESNEKEESNENEGEERTEIKENKKEKENLEEGNRDTEVVSNQGYYYVLLPTSQLQRVQFRTENDLRNMAYTARLQYSNEDKAPLYVYTAVPQYQSGAYVQLY